MARRGSGRSALAVGLLVLAVLVGGRMAGAWHTGELSELAGTRSHPATVHAPRRPTSPTETASAKPSVSSPTGTNAPAHAKRRPTKPRAAHPDPTFGAKRSTGSTAVALTFDDGPDPYWTPQVLDLLRQQRIKATFCLVGVHVRDYPQLVARIAREGHTLCNHTWQHDLKLGAKTPDQIRSDLARTSAAIRKAVPGAQIPYYRQPGGTWTATIVTIAKQLGMTPLGWAVDPSDWSKPGTKAIIARVARHTHAGSIVLLHDGGGERSQTLAACRTLFPWLKQRYRLVPLR